MVYFHKVQSLITTFWIKERGATSSGKKGSRTWEELEEEYAKTEIDERKKLNNHEDEGKKFGGFKDSGFPAM